MSGKIAVVTGAGSGIGRAVALALHAGGYRMVLAGRRADQLERTIALADASGGEMVAVPTDVASPDSVRALFAKTAEVFGRVDVLFNNAGTNAPAVPMEDLTYEQWSRVVETNLNRCVSLRAAGHPDDEKQQPRGGRIINNGSVSAQVPRPHSAPYTATKHGITGLTRSISLDGRAWDIACGQIDIGNAITERTEPIATGILQANGTTAIEARINVQHVAEAVLYMAGLPLDVNVQFMTVMATKMPFIGRG